MNRVYDTYLQKLLCEGDVSIAFVGVNDFDIAIPSEDMDTPPSFVTKRVLILVSDDGIRYSITEEQLEVEKNLMLEKYPELSDTIMSNYNELKRKMEV